MSELHAAFVDPGGWCGFVDRWDPNRDPAEEYAQWCCDCEREAHEAELREQEWLDAMDAECLSRGLIDDDLDDDFVELPGRYRIPLDEEMCVG